MTELQDTCAICGRPLGNRWNLHHLIPKTFKGKVTVPLHLICHRKIHSVFSERELFQYFHTVERILENEEMQRFVKWIQKKDPDFHKATFDLKRKK